MKKPNYSIQILVGILAIMIQNTMDTFKNGFSVIEYGIYIVVFIILVIVFI